MQSQSSLVNFQKFHKKISLHLERQKIKDVTLSSQKSMLSAQKIPQKFILKNSLLSPKKNITPNKKFEWLTKSIENLQQPSKLSSLISRKSSLRSSFSNLRRNQSKTETLINNYKSRLNESLLSSSQKNQKAKTESSTFDIFEDSFTKVKKSQIPQDKSLIGQQNCFSLLKKIQVNSKIMKSQSFQRKSSKTKSIKQNNFLCKQNEEDIKKVLSKENKRSSFVKRKRSQQKQNKNGQDLQTGHKQQQFLVSGFGQKVQNEQIDLFMTPLSNKINFQDLSTTKAKKCIKNLKKEFIHLSKQEKKCRSSYLKRQQKYEEDLKVEPWNLIKQDFEEYGCEVSRFK